MKINVTTLAGKTIKMKPTTVMMGMALLWDLMCDETSPTAKSVLDDMYTLLGAVLYGKVERVDE